MSPVQKFHMDLREIGCIACWMLFGQPRFPVAIHHLFDGHERNDWLVVPLCEPGHHQHGATFGAVEIIPFHPGGERKFRDLHGFGEKEMLAQALKKLYQS
jgi:hypothetical protein